MTVQRYGEKMIYARGRRGFCGLHKMICESTKKRAVPDESEALRIIVICQKDKALREEERDEKDKDLQF